MINQQKKAKTYVVLEHQLVAGKAYSDSHSQWHILPHLLCWRHHKLHATTWNWTKRLKIKFAIHVTQHMWVTTDKCYTEFLLWSATDLRLTLTVNLILPFRTQFSAITTSVTTKLNACNFQRLKRLPTASTIKDHHAWNCYITKFKSFPRSLWWWLLKNNSQAAAHV